jgi:Zn-dependent protease with chaperone function
MLGALAFNLIVNAALSFGFALGVVWLALRLFRVGADRFQQLLLTLPWLKVLWDAAYGIPAGSFFWQRLADIRQDLGVFQLGFGANRWGPLLQFRLGARLGEATYPQSAAEVLGSGLTRLWQPLPSLLAAVVLGVSSVLVCRRLMGWFQHALAQRAQPPATILARGHWRDAAVVIDPLHRGAPYAAGVLEPRIVFAAHHYERLSRAEREACLQHELAHVQAGDTLWSPLIALLGDVLWFVPGRRWLLERHRVLMELRADAAAVHAGACPQALATALVATGDLLLQPSAPFVSLVRERLLARRVRRLLGADEPGPRAGFQYAKVRWLVVLVLLLGVLQSVFFGNQPPP